MIGALAGDIIGSVYEHSPVKTKSFPLFHSQSKFTDDTVLTVAVAHALLSERNYRESVWEWGRRYPNAGYGASFVQWLRSTSPLPYNSWGNGAAMRVSPIGYAYDSVEKVLEEAAQSAAISHDHPHGVQSAQAVALSVYLARTTKDKEYIRDEISRRFNYKLDRTFDEIRPDYTFDVSARGSVPEAIVAFLQSSSYEDAVRGAISLGGDSDTQACIAGGIAEAFYGPVSESVFDMVEAILPEELWLIAEKFYREYCFADE